MDVGNPDSHPVNKGAAAEPAEWPETYMHMLEVAAPLAREHGIPFHWVISKQPKGRLKTLLDASDVIVETYPIRPPKTERARLKAGALGIFDWFWKVGMVPTSTHMICNQGAKIERFNRWLANTHPGEEVEVWIGFNADELERLERGQTYEIEELGAGGTIRHVATPLAEAGLTKAKCIKKIQRAGYPVPVKSACVFCPFGKPWEWLRLFALYPQMFYKVTELWERRSGTVSDEGYVMTPKFSKFGLSRAQYLLLRQLERRPTSLAKIPGNQRTTFKSLLKRYWITERGTLTRYGRDILSVARRSPPRTDKNKSPEERKRQLAIVQTAARNQPVGNVHYNASTLEEWIEDLIEAERKHAKRRGEEIGVCFSEEPAEAALVVSTRLHKRVAEAEKKRGKEKTGRKRRRNPEPFTTMIHHIDVMGRPSRHQYRMLAGTLEPDEVYGHMDFTVCGDLLHVSWLLVRPEHRRKGVATAMYARLYEFAASEQLRVVHGMTTPEGTALLCELGLR
jgi:ribosomal protein S18 acetylase RimI-like enzyme